MAEEKPKKIHRRDLMKLAGVGVAAAALTQVTTPVKAATNVIKGKNYAMLIDLRRCFGCHSCSVACKAEFDVPLGRWRSWVKTTERGRFPDVSRFFLPRLCNQCASPPCVYVCPTKASHIRDNGIVAIHEKLCIGCRNCIAVCPYNSRFSHPVKKIAQKCDFCKHLVEKGVEPACVNTCPSDARIFGDLNDSSSKISKLIAKTPVSSLKPEMNTEPKVFYIDADIQTMRMLGGGDDHV